MPRLIVIFLAAALLSALSAVAVAQPDSSDNSVTYEVQINGETFRVEGNRVVKLQSKEKPGTTYEIAVRIAPTQRVRMNTVQFEYDLPAKITDDHGKAQRVVQMKHELGFSVLISDLGQRLESKDEQEVLKALADSVAGSYREQKGADIKVSAPRQGKFDSVTGQGCSIHYKDAQGFGHTGWAWVLSGEKFSVTCVVQYVDNDSEDVLPLVKKMLSSLRPVP
jgi:hypothetical protein